MVYRYQKDIPREPAKSVTWRVGLILDLPSGYVKIAIENGDLFSIAMLVIVSHSQGVFFKWDLDSFLDATS